MLEIRILGILLIILGCIFIGLRKCSNLLQYNKDLKTGILILEQMKSLIEYKNICLKDIFKELSLCQNKSVKNIAYKMSNISEENYIEGVINAFKENLSYLQNTELQSIELFFKDSLMTDKTSKLRNLQVLTNQLKENLNNQKKEYKNKCKIYLSLSFFAAIMMTIMIV